MLRSSSRLSPNATFQDKFGQLVRGAGINTFFGGFVPVFRPFFCCFTNNLYMKFSNNNKTVKFTSYGRRSANYKVTPHIRGHHFLLYKQTIIKDIETDDGCKTSSDHSWRRRGVGLSWREGFRNRLTSRGTKHWFCSLVVRSICSPVHCTVARFVSAVQAKCNFRFNRRIGSIKLICCQRGGGGQQPMVVFNVYRITRVEWWSITTLTPRLTLVILCRHICQTPALNNILTFCTFCNWLVIWKKHDFLLLWKKKPE